MGRNVVIDVNRNSPARYRMNDMRYQVEKLVKSNFVYPRYKTPRFLPNWNVIKRMEIINSKSPLCNADDEEV